MLEPPDVPEPAIFSALRDGYGVEARALTFLPLGQDTAAWVYRVEALDGRAYFLKLRGDRPQAAGLAVPRYLADQGLAQVPAALRTRSGRLWHPLDDFSIILYPFIEDAQPLPSEQTDEQWRHFGAAMRRIHTTVLPPELAALIQRDLFEPAANDLVLALDAQMKPQSFDEPLARELAAFWCERQREIRAVVAQAEALGQRLRQRAGAAQVLCHTDIHWDNVLLDAQQRLWLVDWDETRLSLKERDLMFVIGGISAGWGTPRDAALFFQGYGPAEIDAAALAFYRADWAVQDIGSYAERVLALHEMGEATRHEALGLFKGLFGPGQIVEKALGTAVD